MNNKVNVAVNAYSENKIIKEISNKLDELNREVSEETLVKCGLNNISRLATRFICENPQIRKRSKIKAIT